MKPIAHFTKQACWTIWFWLALLCFFVSCDGGDEGWDTPDSKGKMMELNFIVRVPAMHKPGSRSDLLPFDEDRENRVGEVSVILFHQDSKGKSDRVFLTQTAKFIKRDEVNPLVYSFKVSYYAPDPEEFGGTFNAIIIANASECASKALPGMTREEVQRACAVTFTNSTADFTPMLPFDDEAPLPMWGEIYGVAFPTGNETEVPTFSATLLRSVARVDLTVDSEISTDEFELVSVSVVNTSNALLTIPDLESLETMAEKAGHYHAVKPSILENGEQTIRWDYDSVAIGNNISHTVYIPESQVRMDGVMNDENHTKRTAVVVGGKWRKSEELQYYRLDFFDEEEGTLLDVLRNHCYTFRINKVDCEGAESVWAAYEDPVIKASASLIEWTLPYKAITYFGDEWISASEERVDLTGNAGAGKVFNVKSSLPLTTFRIRWMESESLDYHKDHTEGDGVEAEIEMKGDMARVAVRVTRDNPDGEPPRLCTLALRVSSQLTIKIPVVVHPLDEPGWQGGGEYNQE